MMAHLKPKFTLIAVLMILFASPGIGGERYSHFSCHLPLVRTALVHKVLNNGFLQLKSGETVRLIGVMPVKYFENTTSHIASKLNRLAQQSIEFLRREVEGKTVELRQNGRSHDRYDHLLAHVYGPDSKWLQGILLRNGLARVFSYKDNRACMQEMLALETMARNKQLGLWRERPFQPIQAVQLKQLSRQRYRFTLVEGKIRKVAIVKKWVFLNFGDNWRRDFTIAIKRKYRKNIARRGLDLEKLKGQKIRVRGWIENWNGPLIKLTHREQIELLGEE